MVEYDENTAREMHQKLWEYHHTIRTERDSRKNLEATQQALKLMDEMDRKFPRDILNKLIREHPL